MNRLKNALAATSVAALLSVTACSDGAGHNDADVSFATEMIPHHAQALAMADLTIGRDGLDPQVADLAERIRGEQTPEINTLTDWLTSWGEKAPTTGYASGDGHTHSDEGMGMGEQVGGDAMPGMMSADDMRRLQDTTDDQAFGDLWLRMMIEHHQGAIDMARTEQQDGESADALALAQRIATAQDGEIDTMRKLLAG
ncbi:MAG: DUF305 domain-containing protein [Nocardioidaceae bacterium]